MARVRYIVNDVDEAVAFYVSKLGFELQQQFGSAVALLERDDCKAETMRPDDLTMNLHCDCKPRQM